MIEGLESGLFCAIKKKGALRIRRERFEKRKSEFMLFL